MSQLGLPFRIYIAELPGSVIVNTATGSRWWQYDLDVKRNQNLEQLKETIVSVVRKVRGVLSDPEPEALIV